MGPVLTIIPEQEIDTLCWKKVIAYIEQISDSIESDENGTNFWVRSKLNSKGQNPPEPRPFLIYVSALDNETELPDGIANFSISRPKKEIVIWAGCSDDADHYLLSQITIEIAKLVDGVIGSDCFIEIIETNESSVVENYRIYKITKEDYSRCRFVHYDNGTILMTPSTMEILSAIIGFRLPK